MKYTKEIELRTCSEFNSNEHWRKKAARHKIQKFIVNNYLKSLNVKIKLPCSVTLTRLSPRKLDEHDNLPGAFKYICDAIADFLIPGLKAGQADSSKSIVWSFKQEKRKEQGIIIEIDEIVFVD